VGGVRGCDGVAVRCSARHNSAMTSRRCRSPKISIRSATLVRAVSTYLSSEAFARGPRAGSSRPGCPRWPEPRRAMRSTARPGRGPGSGSPAGSLGCIPGFYLGEDAVARTTSVCEQHPPARPRSCLPGPGSRSPDRSLRPARRLHSAVSTRSRIDQDQGAPNPLGSPRLGTSDWRFNSP
jgi:hypothetical protein